MMFSKGEAHREATRGVQLHVENIDRKPERANDNSSEGLRGNCHLDKCCHGEFCRRKRSRRNRNRDRNNSNNSNNSNRRITIAKA